MIPGNYNFLYPDVRSLTSIFHDVRIAAPEQARPQINLARDGERKGEVSVMPLRDAHQLHQFSDSVGYLKTPAVDPEKFMKYTTLTGV